MRNTIYLLTFHQLVVVDHLGCFESTPWGVERAWGRAWSDARSRGKLGITAWGHDPDGPEVDTHFASPMLQAGDEFYRLMPMWVIEEARTDEGGDLAAIGRAATITTLRISHQDDTGPLVFMTIAELLTAARFSGGTLNLLGGDYLGPAPAIEVVVETT